jgi:phage shock protein B
MDTGNIAVILSLGVVAPTWIVFHYLSRWRATKTITGEDEKLLQDLWQSADKIERRLHSLEKILDAESPSWRKGAGDD